MSPFLIEVECVQPKNPVIIQILVITVIEGILVVALRAGTSVSLEGKKWMPCIVSQVEIASKRRKPPD